MPHDHDHGSDHEHGHDRERRVAAILEKLRDDGGRVTSARRVVVEALVNGPGHLTAPEVLELVRSISGSFHESSVYRTLDRLVEVGAVTRIEVSGGSAVYHLPAKAHHHLVCDRCGRIIGADPDLLAEVARRVEEAYGFVLRDEAVTLPGRCRSCAAR